MPTTYYIVSAILIASTVILHLRCRHEFHRGYKLGYRKGVNVRGQITQQLGTEARITRVPGARPVGNCQTREVPCCQ